MTQEEPQKQVKASGKASRKVFKGPLLTMMVVAAVVVLGYKLWENPQIIDQLRERVFTSEAKEDVYQPQIDELQRQLTEMRHVMMTVAQKAENPDFSEMNKRIDNIEQINVNTIKSKADVETVLGIIGRMDIAEGRLNDLAKVTDDGALILTAAMLVKDAADRGAPFVYEAEVLSELAAGHHKISKEVARINEIAVTGVPSVDELKNEFAEIYMAKYGDVSENDEVVFENWKDRIYYQLHKVVQIKKSEEEKVSAQQEPTVEDRAFETVRDLLAQGDVYKAIALLKKPINVKMLEEKTLAEWLKHAEVYQDFYDSVSRISANALAVMKVKFLQNPK